MLSGLIVIKFLKIHKYIFYIVNMIYISYAIISQKYDRLLIR